jgi:ferredoxin
MTEVATTTPAAPKKKKLTPGEMRIQVRIWVQWAFLAIAAGPLFVLAPVIKQIPAPWYVCWSCPTAIAACPLGTIQHFTATGAISFFALGILILIGVLMGRQTCGWTCPMGFIQEMLYKSQKWVSYVMGVLVFGTTLFLAWFTPFMGQIMPESGELYGLSYLLETGKINLLIGWGIAYLAVAIAFTVPFFLPMRKFSIPNNFANITRWFFFLVPFILFVIITRMAPAGDGAVKWLEGEVWWCKICPVGTFTAGFPQMYLQLVSDKAYPIFGLTSTAFIGVASYQGIFGEARIMYFFKWTTSVALLYAMIRTARPFCKAICPLGMIFSFTNWVSGTRIVVDQANCRGKSCNWCLKHCPMDIAIYDPTAQWHCIRCLDCLGCPFGVVKHELPPLYSWIARKEEKKTLPLKTPNPPVKPSFLDWAGLTNYKPPQA